MNSQLLKVHQIAFFSYLERIFLYLHHKTQHNAQMNKEILGIKIKERRKILKVRQEDLAEISGVALRTIVTIEGGEGNPSLETLLKIAEVLGMELQLNVKL